MKMAKQIPCDLCPKTFASRQILADHKKIHTGVKEYVCERCNKAFNRSSNLKKHSLIHIVEKPYKCTECTYSSKNHNDLKKHISVHKKTQQSVPPEWRFEGSFPHSHRAGPIQAGDSIIFKIRVFYKA